MNEKKKPVFPIGVCECCQGIIFNKRGNNDKRLKNNKKKRTLYCINCGKYIAQLRNRMKAFYYRKKNNVSI